MLFAPDDAGARLVAAEAIRTRCGSGGGGDRARAVGRTTRGDVLGVCTRKGARARGSALTGGAQGLAGRWRRCHASRRRKSFERKWCAKAAETAIDSAFPYLLTPHAVPKVTIVTIYNSTHRHTQFKGRKLGKKIAMMLLVYDAYRPFTSMAPSSPSLTPLTFKTRRSTLSSMPFMASSHQRSLPSGTARHPPR